jgi:hypothetical protein
MRRVHLAPRFELAEILMLGTSVVLIAALVYIWRRNIRPKPPSLAAARLRN